MKKKNIKKLILTIAVIIVIVALILLIAALQKDTFGLNWFQRQETIVNKDGATVKMYEFSTLYEVNAMNVSSSTSATYTADNWKALKQSTAEQLLYGKLARAEAPSLGIALTDAEKQSCATSAQSYVDSVASAIKSDLESNNSFTVSYYETQLRTYYRSAFGMNQSQLYKFLCMVNENNQYASKVVSYKIENKAADDATLEAYYKAYVEENYTGTNAGDYSAMMTMYQYYGSYVPVYVPEDYYYVEMIEISKPSRQEAKDVYGTIVADAAQFDTLKASDDNIFTYKSSDKIPAPYVVGYEDYSYLIPSSTNSTASDASDVADAIGDAVSGTSTDTQDFYQMVRTAEIGAFGAYYVDVDEVKDDDGNVTTEACCNVYIFKKVEGTLCYDDAQSGIIKFDFFPGAYNEYASLYWYEQFTKDAVISDNVYAIKVSVEG